MTMAAPQALITSETYAGDVAQRNRTIHDLAHRVTAIQRLHARPVPEHIDCAAHGKVHTRTMCLDCAACMTPDAPGECPACLEDWPCPTWLLATGEHP